MAIARNTILDDLETKIRDQLNQQDLGKAQELLEKMVSIDSEHPATLFARGLISFMTGDFTCAIESADKALGKVPHGSNDFYKGVFMLSRALLAAGDLENGWKVFDERIGLWTEKRGVYLDNLWRGQDLKGKSITVFMEQGIADQIVCLPLLVDLQEYGAHIKLIINDKLLPLFQRSLPEVECQGNNGTLTIDINPQEYWAPLFSLARYMRTSIPFRPHIPFQISEEKRLIQREFLSAFDGKLKVGISWAGGKQDKVRNKEFTDIFSDWLPVLETPEIDFFSVQYNDVSQELKKLKEDHGYVVHVPPIDQFDDLDTTAAFMSELDLVIGIPTASIKLAHGSGTDTWCLHPFDPGITERAWVGNAKHFCKRIDASWQDLFAAVKEATRSTPQ